MSSDPRLHSPAADRNKGPIGIELQRVLPARGALIEIASGSGQHAAHLSAQLPGWAWYPTDADPAALASTNAWCAEHPAVRPAQALDLLLAPVDAPWPGLPLGVDAIYCANLLHISPWPVCAALLQGAARHLAPRGLLVLYGPWLEDGVPTAPGNLAFDADLRARNPAWGLRRLPDVLQQASAAGLRLRERVPMPANNLMLVLERAPAPAA